MSWTRTIQHDPSRKLLASKSEALRYFTKRDLIDEDPGVIDQLWHLPAMQRWVQMQSENGAWNYHWGREHIRSSEDYDQIETYRILRELVEKYGVNRKHPLFEKAADFLFSHQSVAGDFRGIAGHQYVPYYSAGMMELLIKGGYSEDPRIEKGFKWLLSIRQDDGGWAFPLRTVGLKLKPETFAMHLVEPDRKKPFSHLVTGMVLRAFAAHPSYRKSREAKIAGELLAGRFFKPDQYADRQAASFWTSFSFPFWFTDLLSSLDSLSQMGFGTDHPLIAKGVEWFISRQKEDGLWKLRLRIMAREPEPNHWISLAICRVLKRLGRYGEEKETLLD